MDNNGEVVAPVTAQDFVDALQYVLTPDYASSNVGLDVYKRQVQPRSLEACSAQAFSFANAPGVGRPSFSCAQPHRPSG